MPATPTQAKTLHLTIFPHHHHAICRNFWVGVLRSKIRSNIVATRFNCLRCLNRLCQNPMLLISSGFQLIRLVWSNWVFFCWGSSEHLALPWNTRINNPLCLFLIQISWITANSARSTWKTRYFWVQLISPFLAISKCLFGVYSAHTARCTILVIFWLTGIAHFSSEAFRLPMRFIELSFEKMTVHGGWCKTLRFNENHIGESDNSVRDGLY